MRPCSKLACSKLLPAVVLLQPIPLRVSSLSFASTSTSAIRSTSFHLNWAFLFLQTTSIQQRYTRASSLLGWYTFFLCLYFHFLIFVYCSFLTTYRKQDNIIHHAIQLASSAQACHDQLRRRLHRSPNHEDPPHSDRRLFLPGQNY